jgi:hypothetical protein
MSDAQSELMMSAAQEECRVRLRSRRRKRPGQVTTIPGFRDIPTCKQLTQHGYLLGSDALQPQLAA